MGEKYMKIRRFILENFETTRNIKDRLHTQDILDILSKKEFQYNNDDMAKIFKSLEIGKHRSSCVINSKNRAGYYFIRYKGET